MALIDPSPLAILELLAPQCLIKKLIFDIVPCISTLCLVLFLTGNIIKFQYI